MQTDESTLEEVPVTHLAPSVVVGIADDEAREHEEEVHRQIAMVDVLRAKLRDVSLEAMEEEYHQRSYAAQSVQYLISRLGRQVNVFVLCHYFVII